MKKELSLQEYLSIGYLFLIALGIARDAIFYAGMGINVFNYANVMDILMSPISYIGGRIVNVVLVLLVLTWPVYIPIIKSYLRSKKNQQVTEGDETIETKAPEIEEINYRSKVGFIALMLTCFFLGTGIGGGSTINSKLKMNDFEYNDRITFQKKTKAVHIVSQNSNYLFYTEKGKKGIIVSPIYSNISKIVHGKKK